MPVRILGWNTMPACGIDFVTVKNKKEAETLVEQFELNIRNKKNVSIQAQLKTSTPTTSSDESTPQIVTIPLIIKADVIGSLDGVKHELAKIKHDRVQLKIVSEGIGDINENDIKVAMGDPHVHIVGFNAPPEKKAAAMIERSAIPLSVKNFNIIYELSQYVKDALTSKIPKQYVEEMTGRAKLLAVFSKDKDRQVVGGKVETGSIFSGNDVRIMRRETEIGRGKIRGLQQAKKTTDEVREGFEFGMMLDAKVEVAPGDRIEAVRTVEKV